MRRLAVGLAAVLIVIVLAEHRVSEDRPGLPPGSLPEPVLWHEARHGAEPALRSDKLICKLALSMDRGNPYRLTAREDGVRFDIDADGAPDQVSWPERGSDVAFLAVDRNGDGRITNGRELIGESTLPGVHSGPSALIALAYERGGAVAGTIGPSHPFFFDLLLWTDANHNGISDPPELRAAHQVLSAIGLGFGYHHRQDEHGNQSRYRGFVYVTGTPRPELASFDDNGLRRPMYDLCLRTRTTAAGESPGH
jgi:hypothetical protein